MKHESCRALYNYWDRLREGAPAPTRGAIEPAAISEHLRDTFILEATNAAYPFRLAGTRLCAILGKELRGTSFLNVWAPMEREQILAVLQGVADEGAGAVLGVSARGQRDGDVGLELLLLPLVQSGPNFDRILGALMPMQLPFWLGLEPLRELEVTSARQLRSHERGFAGQFGEPQPIMAAVAAATHQPEHRRNRFVVLDGGKAKH